MPIACAWFIQSARARPRSGLAGTAGRAPLLAPLLEAAPADRSLPSSRSAWLSPIDEPGPAAALVQLMQVSSTLSLRPLPVAWLTGACPAGATMACGATAGWLAGNSDAAVDDSRLVTGASAEVGIEPARGMVAADAPPRLSAAGTAPATSRGPAVTSNRLNIFSLHPLEADQGPPEASLTIPRRYLGRTNASNLSVELEIRALARVP